ncbi:MAG: 4'-phosphopantetheinyl transferase superfamily protein [Lentisphaerae bacterium]|nr:4'-phosphopantetheinyl transferase superfamily protein [Lentisphaerota bacterium]
MCAKLSFTPLEISAETPVCIGVALDEDLDGWMEAALPYVTDQERAHAERFVHLIDGVRHLVGRALVRKTLKTVVRPYEVGDFLSTQYGRPYSDQTDIDFSISHSGAWVWAAFSRKGQIGIDIEKVRKLRDLLGMAKMFHPQEIAEIQAVPENERPAYFYRCWVRKEALLKANGEGLSKPLDSFCVYTDERRNDWINTDATPEMKGWFTQDLAVGEGCFCSVAVTAPVKEIFVLQVKN